MTDTPDIFNTYGCVQVDQLIDHETTQTISQYFQNKIARGEWQPKDNPITKLFYYADPLIEVLLLRCKDTIENICGKELIPTYSYSRVYQSGEELKTHVDRPACEISVTVNVANLGGISPIYMQYKDNPVSKHLLSPGDAIIYKGCEAKHWRLPLEEGQLNVQFMLHYVDKNGPNIKHAKDKRPYYAAPLDSRIEV